MLIPLRLRLVAVLAAHCVVLLPCASALTPTNFSPAKHNRFSTWDATTDTYVANTSPLWVGAGYNFSGVLWNTETFGTESRAMMTPRHTVGVRHTRNLFPEPTLVGASGQVLKVFGVPGVPASLVGEGVLLNNTPDITLESLGSYVDPSYEVTSYGVLDLDTAVRPSPYTAVSPLVGMQCFVYGHAGGWNINESNRVVKMPIQDIQWSSDDPAAALGFLQTRFVQGSPTDEGGFVSSGDSGGPTFVPWTDPAGIPQLTVVSVHSSVSMLSEINIDSLILRDPVIGAMNIILTKEGYAVRRLRDATTFWKGAGSGFADSAGWTGAAAPLASDYLGLDPAQATVRTIGLGGATGAARGLVFHPAATAEAFIFSNGTLELGRGGMANYGAATHAFGADLALRLTDHQYWDARLGGFTAGGPVNLNGRLLVVQGGFDTSIAGGVSDSTGTGPGLTKDGGGRLTLGGANTYAGTTWLYDGTLAFGSGSTLPTGTKLIIAKNSRARLEVGGSAFSLAQIKDFDARGRSTIDLGPGGSLALTHPAADSATSYTGLITGGTSGSDSLLLSGTNTATVTLGGMNDFLGKTRILGSTVTIAHAQTLGAAGAGNETEIFYQAPAASPVVTFSGGGTVSESLRLVAVNAPGTNFTTPPLTFNAATDWTGPITLVRGADSSSRLLTYDIRTGVNSGDVRLGDITTALHTGGVLGSGNILQVTAAAGSSARLDGAINDGTGGAVRVDCRGEGELRVSGSSSYTGTTSLNAARVVIASNAPHGAPGALGNSTGLVRIGTLDVGLDREVFAANGITVGRSFNVNSWDPSRKVRVGVGDNATALFSGNLSLFRETTLHAGTNSMVTFSGELKHISAVAGVVKSGAGTVVLSGPNTYQGATTVSEGTLLVNGSTVGGTATVAPDARIGGSGRLGGSLTLQNGAQIVFAPGNTLTVNGAAVSLGNMSVASVIGLSASTPVGTYTLLGGTATFDFSQVQNLGEANRAILGSGKYAWFEQGSLKLVVSAEGFAAWIAGFPLTGDDALPTADPDGDGQTNEQEHVFDTIPNDSNSSYTQMIEPVASPGTGLVITFDTKPGRSYQVERSFTLGAGSWVPFGAPITGSGTPATVTDTSGTTPAFYRVRTTLLP